MLKNERLISKMSVEQKIKLVSGTSDFKNSPVDNYEFPIFGPSDFPLDGCDGGAVTVFPSEKSLASTWNTPLVKGIYKYIGNETKACVPYACFCVSDDLKKTNVSDDSFYGAKFAAAKIKGVNESGAYICFKGRDDKSLATFYALTEAEPDFVLTDSCHNEKMCKDYKYGKLFFAEAADKEGFAKAIYNGCTLVYLQGDISDDVVPYVTELTEKYERAAYDKKIGRLSLAEFERMNRECEILDGALLDAACDRLISVFLAMKAQNADAVREKKISLDAERAPLFDEISHRDLAREAAAQSVIMLKNDGALPLGDEVKVAVVGECAKETKYFEDIYSSSPTSLKLPFEAINDFDINHTGYAHGYAKGEVGRDDLVKTACGLCRDADYAVVFLSAEKGETKLPAGQLELIDALYERNVKIIACVSADGVIDTAFEDKCKALLFTYRGGQEYGAAIFDIITGKASPSGKLVEAMPRDLDNYAFGEKISESNVKYPFGYGLSYTEFAYTNLKIDERGVSFTVTNTGGYDGYATMQLYVQTASGDISDKALRGFNKVFVGKNDTVKVQIPFDRNTFAVYDETVSRYHIIGGQYSVYVTESSTELKLHGDITLQDYIYDEEVFANEIEEEGGDFGKTFYKFAENKDKRSRYKEARGLSFGMKLFIAIAIWIYYDAVSAVFAFGGLIGKNELIPLIVVGVLAVVFNVLEIVYVVKISKSRKKRTFTDVNEALTDLVDNVNEFTEIAKVTYSEPVQDDTDAEEEFAVDYEDEDEDEEEWDEPVEERDYESRFDDTVYEEPVFTETVSFGELCSNFAKYALTKGVQIEAASVRSIMAAVASSKIVFLSSKNKDALPDLLNAVSGYFGGSAVTRAEDGWDGRDSLIWTDCGDKYVISDFMNAVYMAGKTPEKNCAVVIENVNPDNLKSYFGDFISYALHPTEERSIAVNGELTLTLPNNMCYILVPQDGYEDKITAEIANASLQIEAVITKTDAAEAEDTEIKAVTANALNDLVKEAREAHFVSEKVWDKTDELVAAINASERFVIGNKNLLTLEKFTSVLLDCGADDGEGFNAMYTAKILPLLKTTKLYAGEDGEKTVYGMIEKLFNEEDLTKIKKSLVKNG